MSTRKVPKAAPAAEPMLSIGAVSRATGIPVETLRTWERRYGFPEASRRPSGHRLYPLAAVGRLRRIASALAQGHRPGELLKLGEIEVDSLLLATPGPATAARSPEPPRSLKRRERIARAPLTPEDLLESVADFDGVRLTLALEASAALRSPVRFLEETLQPLMDLVGRRWEEGTLEVRHEHFVTACASAVLADLRRRHEHSGGGPHVAMALLPGDRHELGLLMAGVVFVAAGWRVVYLGLETPVVQLVALANEASLEAVAVSVSSTAPAPVTADLRQLARSLPPATDLVVGGSGARARSPALRFASLSELSKWAAARARERKPRRSPEGAA